MSKRRRSGPPERLLAVLRKRENRVFLVSAHVHLEGDALGAELGMARLLAALGKTAVVVNDDKTPAEYEYLPGIRTIRSASFAGEYDVAVAVDCSDLSRIGKVARCLKDQKPLVNIDHHVSNTFFGDVNWVNPGASCACEMVYELYKALGVRIRRPEALLLYTGILVDTGSFRYVNTSPHTHRIAAELMECGLDVYRIHRALNESMSPVTIRSFGKIIDTLRVDPTGRVAWLVMKHAWIRKDPSLADQTDALVHFARSIKGVECALLFKEVRPGQEIRVNLRSTGKVDVNKVAKALGGGGHKMASGITLRGTLKESVAKVTREAERNLR